MLNHTMKSINLVLNKVKQNLLIKLSICQQKIYFSGFRSYPMTYYKITSSELRLVINGFKNLTYLKFETHDDNVDMLISK